MKPVAAARWQEGNEMKNRNDILGVSVVLAVLLVCGTAGAIDGVVLIDQARALAGNVTPGDTPGFPVTISVPGSYRLSGNLTVPNENTTAIQATADDVSIDLNGFAILGPTVCGGSPVSCTPTGTGSGIDLAGLPRSTRISNGEIRGMGRTGLHTSGNATVSNLRAVSNGQTGISVVEGILTGNDASLNGFAGMNLSGSATVTGNRLAANGGPGLSGLNFGLISGNTFVGNANVGINVASRVGYWGNVFAGNNGGGAQVSGGLNLGNNQCETALCP